MKNKSYLFTALLILLFTFLLNTSSLFAASVTLNWNVPTKNVDGTDLTDFKGYKLYYGFFSGQYHRVIDIGNVSNYKINNLNDGLTYCFALTAYDTSGNESDYSEETCKTSSRGDSFSHDFNRDTTGEYVLTDTWTSGGRGQLIYDAVGRRAQMLTGDNIGFQISRQVAPRDSGNFSIDFLPHTKYPAGGIMKVRLMEDQDNYYEIYNTDGYRAGYMQKVVNGIKVDSAEFHSGYSQDMSYRIRVIFSPDWTTVEAFGEVLDLDMNKSSIIVSSFEIQISQQDAYFDNIFYDHQIDYSSEGLLNSYFKTDVIGDVDGNGRIDFITDSDTAAGIWVFYNNSTWAQIHGTNPEVMTAGDIDGNGQDDVIAGFGSSGGTWVYYNNSTWVRIHGSRPETMITGDMDGSGHDEIIMDFGPASGTWVYYNDTSWLRLYNFSPETIAVGDVDGTGLDDVILDLGSVGTWIYYNNKLGAWKFYDN
jgi:hypothetical protein